MTELLQQVISEIQKLLADRHDAIASFLDTEALGFADCKLGRGQ